MQRLALPWVVAILGVATAVNAFLVSPAPHPCKASRQRETQTTAAAGKQLGQQVRTQHTTHNQRQQGRVCVYVAVLCWGTSR